MIPGIALGRQCRSISARVSSHASRVWITIGFPASRGHAHLLDEHIPLRLTRRKIVMIIEPDLAQRNHLRMPQQFRQAAGNVSADRLRSIVRMHAHRRVDRRIAIRQPDSGFQIRRTIARPDRDHALDARRERALDHGFAIGIELFVIQMAMRVDQHF